VPIDAIIFGGRRAKTAPLVYQARGLRHGVFMARPWLPKTTPQRPERWALYAGIRWQCCRSADTIWPDYFAHWLDMGEKLGGKAPKIFNVNWFRTDDDGNFIWPGFGDNMRVLMWILDRAAGKGNAVETPIGYGPTADDINLEGLAVDKATVGELLNVDRDIWRQEAEGIREFYTKFEDTLPTKLKEELVKLESNLK
jgi:phosphoenolpyruvate carboxykinase (GTP)